MKSKAKTAKKPAGPAAAKPAAPDKPKPKVKVVPGKGIVSS